MSSQLLSIHSNSSDRMLTFSAHNDDYFHVELSGNAISAQTGVWAYTDANGLNNLFQKLGCLEKPWQGTHSWVSIEEEFSISATCTIIGHVTLFIKLCGLIGSPEEWRVQAGISIDFGQLEIIAKMANSFFKTNNT